MKILGIIAIIIGSGAFIWKTPRTVLMRGSACFRMRERAAPMVA